MVRWLYERVRVTGESWNQLVDFYGLARDSWVKFKEPDLVCTDGKWRRIPATDGAGTAR